MEELMQQIITEMEAQKEYCVDSKAGKRKEAKKNAAIDKCIEIVKKNMSK